MKFFQTSTDIKYKFDVVCENLFKRYPNPWSKHVLSEDVISRTIENSTLKTVRLLTKTNKAPRWVERFVSNHTACILEESHVNPVEKKVITYTKNLTHQSLMTVEERCEYTISPQTREWTIVDRKAWVTSGFSGLGIGRAVESFGCERYKNNIKKSTKGWEYILSRLHTPEKPPPILISTLPLAQPMWTTPYEPLAQTIMWTAPYNSSHVWTCLIATSGRSMV